MHFFCRLQLSRKAMLPKLLFVEDAELRLRKAFKPVTTDTPVGGSQVGPSCTWLQSCKVHSILSLTRQSCPLSWPALQGRQDTPLNLAALQALKRKLMARKLFVPWGSTTPLAVQRQPVQSQAVQTPVDQKVGCQHSIDKCLALLRGLLGKKVSKQTSFVRPKLSTFK